MTPVLASCYQLDIICTCILNCDFGSVIEESIDGRCRKPNTTTSISEIQSMIIILHCFLDVIFRDTKKCTDLESSIDSSGKWLGLRANDRFMKLELLAMTDDGEIGIFAIRE